MFHINDLFSSSSSSSAIGGNDIIPCLPEVTIIYAHQGLNNEIFKFVINDLKSKGIILATMVLVVCQIKLINIYLIC